MNTRLEQLQEFLKEDPHDPFNIYALALEYQKSDLQKSKELYNQLLVDFENYIPAYYHAGNLYLELGLQEEAIKIFATGIIQAKKQNELKAMRELQTVYDELM